MTSSIVATRVIRRVVAVICVLLVATACQADKLPAYSPTASLPEVPFRTAEEHDEVMQDCTWPYVLELTGSPGALLYYGSRHTSNPDDPQIEDMRKRWEAFRPTVAVTENRGGFHLGGLARTVKSLGEFGVAIHAAKSADLPIWTLEPTWDDEVAEVTAVYSPAEATLFYTLRVFLAERGDDRSPSEVDKLARHLLKKRGSRPGLAGSLPTLDAMDALWRSSFDDPRDWRELPPPAIWPGKEPTHLQAISRHVNQVRDRHAARILIELVRRGERVFAVAGGSHVVKQEPVLFAALAEGPVHPGRTVRCGLD